MYYPYRDDFKCPECKTGTMKWQGMEFHSTYVLGQSFCDNPECINNRNNYFSLDMSRYKNYGVNNE